MAAPPPHRLYLEEELTQDGDGPAGGGGTAAGAGGAAATAAGAPPVGADDGAGDDAAHLGAVACSIVGMRYYDGVVHQGEWVELVREPANPYDANAIRVENMARVQVSLTLYLAWEGVDRGGGDVWKSVGGGGVGQFLWSERVLPGAPAAFLAGWNPPGASRDSD